MIYSVNIVNNTLQNVYLRYFIFILSGIFLGYTLQPVPLWINHLFNTSNIFKFFIIFFSTISIFYPMDPNEMTITFVMTFCMLILFTILRSKEVEKTMNKLLKLEEDKK